MNRQWLLASTAVGLLVGGMCFGAAVVRDEIPADTIETEDLWRVPLGVPAEIPTPDDNPFTQESVLLGRRLFFDPILSASHDRACATCHQPEHGFASPDALSPAIGGGMLERHAPSLINRAFGTVQMWDGRFDSLEAQALMPIEHEQEMGLPIEEALRRLREHDEYPGLFEQAYGEGPNRDTLARAIASFVRRLTYGDTVFDQFRDGDILAMNRAERAGMWIFQSKANCWKCHDGFNLSDEAFHNTGVGAVDGVPRPGREQHSGDPADTGAFKTPTLRGLLETPPYFHDGSAATLRDVVEFYNDGGVKNTYLDPLMEPLNLSDEEIDMIVAFLGSMSRKVAADDTAASEPGE